MSKFAAFMLDVSYNVDYLYVFRHDMFCKSLMISV
jgi:hypothetical protein